MKEGKIKGKCAVCGKECYLGISGSWYHYDTAAATKKAGVHKAVPLERR